LEATAKVLDASHTVADPSTGDSSLLRYLGYDDGDTAQAEGRARMLRARPDSAGSFFSPFPDAPGLIFFGGEADPATLGKRQEGLPVGNLAGLGTVAEKGLRGLRR